MEIEIKNISKHALPAYLIDSSAGMDSRANINKDILVEPLEPIFINRGLFLEIPVIYETGIFPVSGLAVKRRIITLIPPEKIESD